MTIILILTIIQIVTESFPISSSGHICLISLFFNKHFINYSFAISESFEAFMHGPTVLVLMSFFYSHYKNMFLIFIKNPTVFLKKILIRNFDKTYFEKRRFLILRQTFMHVVTACFATSLLYFLKKCFLNSDYFLRNSFFLGINFSITMIILFLLYFIDSKKNSQKLSQLNFIKSFLIGIAQGISLILTGISRFALTYFVCRVLNLNKKRAFHFAFLIQLPLIFAAFLFKGLKFSKVLYSLLHFKFFLFIFSMFFVTYISYFLFLRVYKFTQASKLWIFGFYMFIPITICFLFATKFL